MKVDDTVYLVILRPGSIMVVNGQLTKRPPQFVVLEGVVKDILPAEGKHPELTSIEIPRWPLRYVAKPGETFTTLADAEKVAVEKTAKHIRVDK